MTGCVTINPQTETILSFNYNVSFVCYYKWLVLISMSTSQMFLKLSIPNDLQYFYIFIHNKDQMYFPKIDQMFGSYYFLLEFPTKYKNTTKYENGVCLTKRYKLQRTHWTFLDKKRNRCDQGKTAAKTTECITEFMEQNVNCSIGLQGSNSNIKRYIYYQAYYSPLLIIFGINHSHPQMQWNSRNADLCKIQSGTGSGKWHRDIHVNWMPVQVWQILIYCPCTQWSWDKGLHVPRK